MLNFGPTFIWTIVNLLVLYIILRKVLFVPVTKFMDNRTQSIKNDIENAEKFKAESEKAKQRYENQLKDAHLEADRIVKDARRKADDEYKAIIDTAQKQAEELIAKAHEEIELERQHMIKNIRNEVAGLALSAASKVMEANMNTELNRKLVDKFIDEAGAA
jgi:F-type H+-transporting ATPase subunit b